MISRPAFTRSTCRQRVALSLALVLSLQATAGLMLPVWAKPSKANALQPFLPPVATINTTAASATPLKEVGDPLEPISLAAIGSPAVTLNAPVKALGQAVSVRGDEAQLKGIISLQQDLEEADLKMLWEATVDKNPVIRFSLEKLALPQDLHQKHASRFLTKTMSALVTGTTLAAMTMLPAANSYQNMGLMTGGDILRNLVTGQNKEMTAVLTPTEQIQLAGLVDDLKARLIQSYHNYQNSLQSLAVAHERAVKSNARYAKALQGKDDIATMAAGAAYYEAMQSELQVKNAAKLERLQLERLAGVEAVNKLQLSLDPSQVKTAAGDNALATTMTSAQNPDVTFKSSDEVAPLTSVSQLQEQSTGVPMPSAAPMDASGMAKVSDIQTPAQKTVGGAQ